MAISDKDKVKLKARLYMKFTGESGLDYGGLARCVRVCVCARARACVCARMCVCTDIMCAYVHMCVHVA